MEINVKEYLIIIKKRMWLIAICVLGVTILTALYTSSNYQPIYQASTKLIVNKTVEQDQLGKEQIDYGAIGVNLALMNTFKEIIRTPAIMDKVVQRYPDLNVSTDQLISIVYVSNLNETQVMTISARHFSHEKAVKIANAVSDVFQLEIPKIMKVDNVTILNRAKSQDYPIPINQKSNQYIILSFIVSLAGMVGLTLLLDALDDTIKTDEDVRDIFAAPTMAYIPKFKDKDKEPRTKRSYKSSKKTGETPYAKTIH
ncbi:Wzz/FepE/Etk N-terminal domain-containing protein [Paenibacillus sp. HWE-109]|uniref:YveK family protein n=1 Tax=Paenibacillus sp. HWE-109 TaxID=1306526 RepID=UPI001EE0D587|nr:Wzz/FepE/Etk N-terminal domain-containing protein [Paenibacillus sp. HWE-109]UKS24935.1 Wzz/FepE/Etk N-terminal domain-containing protein [Paenibacillus sp. HWE-109]